MVHVIDRITVDVGAQHLRGTVRITVLNAGSTEQGSFVVVAVGSSSSAERVRLRVGESCRLPSGGSLLFAAFNGAGRRGSVALEIVS